jgi:hypothetical protein
MATRPTSVRGKNTRLGKLKKVKKFIKEYEAKNSPGGLDSTKRLKLEKKTPKLIRMEKGPKRIQNPKAPNTRMDKGPRKMPNPRQESTRMDKGPTKMSPLLGAQNIRDFAKKMKPTGRINASDLKRAAEQLSRRTKLKRK